MENGYEVKDCPYSGDGIEVLGQGAPLSLKLPYHAGFSYPQDAASMFAVELFDPQPGETVVDLTAAPGGKSSHIAQKMQNTGVLFSNDLDHQRLKALHYNLERLGVWNAAVTRLNPFHFSRYFPETFDRVLLDPSCSGEGLWGTSEGQMKFWNLKKVKRHAQDQFNLLCSAFRLLKPGGRLVYSTCTLNALEDDEVVKSLLEKFPEAKLVKKLPKSSPPQIGDLMGLRFWPHLTQTKGFFCIAITKTASLNLEPEGDEYLRLKALSSAQAKVYTSYLKENFAYELPEHTELVEEGEFIYLVSKGLAQMKLPKRFQLSFPFFKKDPLKLCHGASLVVGAETNEASMELSVEEAIDVFEKKMVVRSQEGALLLKQGAFPLGLCQSIRGETKLQYPKEY